MNRTLNELHKIEPKYSKTELTEFKDENQFMDAYVELLKQTITLLFLIVGDRYCEGTEGIPRKINRNEAIIGGNLTRLIKLNTSFLENICNGKLEICYILNRCIAETAINTQFMIVEGEENVLRNYIKYSLITEKELWNTIKDNVEDRNNEKLHIEERMQKSIERSFNSSDFDLESVNRSSKWKSIAKRAEYVAGDQLTAIPQDEEERRRHRNVSKGARAVSGRRDAPQQSRRGAPQSPQIRRGDSRARRGGRCRSE